MFISNLLISFLTLLTFGYATDTNHDCLVCDCNSVADFLINNLDDFVRAVNSEQDETEEPFICNSVEKRILVDLERNENNEKAVLLDFDGYNGYILLADEFEMLDFSARGASPFEEIVADRYLYSPHGGFYYELNNQLHSIDNAVDVDLHLMSGERRHYNGQHPDLNGCGGIEQPGTYINSCYGNTYNLVASKSLSITRFTQNFLSCYITTNGSSEGNCGLVAGYHTLQCLQKSKWSDLPDVSQRCHYDPYLFETDVYFKRFDLTGRPLYDNVRRQNESILSQWPVLYKETRMYCVNRFGKCDNFIVNQISATMEHIASDYGYNIDAREDPFYKLSLDKGINEINSNEPLVFYTYEDETYGSHFVSVCGYKKYQEVKKIWFFEQINTVILYEIADGWGSNARYYDMSATSSLGMLIFIDIK